MTLRELLQQGMTALQAISPSADVDAQYLLLHVLQKPRSYLYSHRDAVPAPDVIHAFEQLLARRIGGEPVAYITGSRGFWNLELNCAPSTLIPRSDTESLVEWILEHHTQPDLTLLDLGTGTGAIALALAGENPSWQVTGVDLRDEAVALARQNAQINQINNAEFFRSNWFSALAGKKFHIIVSNPPYIDPQDVHLAQGDVRFEPRSALVAAENGYADLWHIAQHAPVYLHAGGLLIMEHGFEQGAKTSAYLTQLGYHDVQTGKDLTGNDRFTLGYWPAQ
ncbi:MAG: peptide chain release factor N(5)-glutamine methyltransferase [Oceanospirillaceae bacterium]|nr:peptide chain release factor N(5)-glutamine methyltransferase [Oceanospirillaceae bacterium]